MKPREYVKAIGGWRRIFHFNCLAYALSQTEMRRRSDYSLPRKGPDGRKWSIEEAFEDACAKLGVEVKQVNYEIPGHVYVYLYGWIDGSDFHVVRREANGRVYHKWGWFFSPEEIRPRHGEYAPGECSIFEIIDEGRST